MGAISPYAVTSGTDMRLMSPAYGFENTDEDDEDSGLIHYWRIIRRHSRVILLSSVAGLILGFAIGIPMKPVYRTRTSLEVLTLNEDFMNMKQSSPTTTNDSNYDTSEEETQAKMLESESLLKRTILKLDPEANGTTTAPSKSSWRSWFSLPESAEISPLEAQLRSVAATLKVLPRAHTRILEVSVDSTDPKLAAKFANTLTQEFIAQNMEARWATTQRTGDWLKRELDDARDKLRHSEDALQAYARVSGLIFTDDTTNLATEKLQQLQQSLTSSTSDRIAKQSRLELAEHAPPDSLADVLGDSSLRETQAKINDVKRQIADVSTIYSPEYSKVRRLQNDLEALQLAYDRQREDILRRIKNDFVESARKENLLQAAYGAQAHEVSGQDEKAIQYNILKRDVDSNRQLYDTMLQQMKQASISSAMRASNVRIIDPAEIPNRPISPNFKANALIGMLSGMCLSIVVAIFRERADRTLQQPGDIKLWLELAELGTIPSAGLGGQRSLQYKALKGTGTPAIRPPSESVELVTSHKGSTLIAEAFRSTLTSILFMGENGDRPKALAFSSANAGDGKTTVVSNLAIAAAEIRMRVLIIDADLRRPRMHHLFGVANETGLSDLLRGDLANDDVHEFIRKTHVENLHILPAGPPTDAASHLLYSPNFSEILTILRGEYDIIFIDTPPMLQMTDARVAGRLADAVVLVARSNQTTRDSLLAAKQRLADDRLRVLGAVLNDWDPKRSTGGYYGYYRSANYTPYTQN